MTKKQVTYSDHAEQRMFERGISKETVEGIIDEWDVIEEDLKEDIFCGGGKRG